MSQVVCPFDITFKPLSLLNIIFHYWAESHLSHLLFLGFLLFPVLLPSETELGEKTWKGVQQIGRTKRSCETHHNVHIFWTLELHLPLTAWKHGRLLSYSPKTWWLLPLSIWITQSVTSRKRRFSENHLTQSTCPGHVGFVGRRKPQIPSSQKVFLPAQREPQIFRSPPSLPPISGGVPKIAFLLAISPVLSNPSKKYPPQLD